MNAIYTIKTRNAQKTRHDSNTVKNLKHGITKLPHRVAQKVG